MAVGLGNIALGVGLLLAAILLLVRLIAIKAGWDPIARRYKPGTPAHAAFDKLLKPRRYVITLTLALLGTLAIAAFLAINVFSLLNAHTASSTGTLVAGVAVAFLMFVTLLVIGYNLLIKYYDSSK